MKTLVIRFSSAGDIILTSLFVRALRKRFPDGEITFLTRRAFLPLVEHSPHIDRVVALDDPATLGRALALRKELLRENFDIVFDLHNSLRSRIVRFGLGKKRAVFRKPGLRKRLLVRFKINLLRPIVPIPERYLAVGEPYGLHNDGLGLELFTGAIQSPLPDELPAPLIALAPGARHFTKRWPAERFAALGRLLLERHGGTILLLGGPDEIDTCREVEEAIAGTGSVLNLAGRTTIPEAAAAIDRCAVVVGNDSALAHVAAARGVPVIAIFGSTVEEFGFAPYSEKAVIVRNSDLPCRPCTTIGRSECPLGHFRCMTEIGIDVPAERIIAMLQRQAS